MPKEQPPLWFAYSDDSPTLSNSSSHLVTAVVVTFKAGDKRVTRLPKRIREKVVGKRLRNLPELKFHNSDKVTRTRMLEMLASEEVEIFALAVDKCGRQPSDSPENKGIVLGNAAAMVINEKERVTLTPDREFVTDSDIATYLNTAERVAASRAKHGFLTLREPATSQREALIQVADFVAGAVSYKYNGRDDRYYQIIRRRIVVEKVVRWVDLKADFVDRGA